MSYDEKIIGKISVGRLRDDSINEAAFKEDRTKKQSVKTCHPDKRFSSSEHEAWKQYIHNELKVTQEKLRQTSYDPFFHSLGMTASKYEETVRKNS